MALQNSEHLVEQLLSYRCVIRPLSHDVEDLAVEGEEDTVINLPADKAFTDVVGQALGSMSRKNE
jgi:hypothetical protein